MFLVIKNQMKGKTPSESCGPNWMVKSSSSTQKTLSVGYSSYNSSVSGRASYLILYLVCMHACMHNYSPMAVIVVCTLVVILGTVFMEQLMIMAR